MSQLPDTTVHDDMLMDLDIAHRLILISQSALEASFAAPKKGQLPETVSSKPKFLSKKIEPKENPVPMDRDRDSFPNLIGQIWGQHLVASNSKIQSFWNESESSAHCRFFGQPPW